MTKVDEDITRNSLRIWLGDDQAAAATPHHLYSTHSLKKSDRLTQSGSPDRVSLH
jgi:hypothetical protein